VAGWLRWGLAGSSPRCARALILLFLLAVGRRARVAAAAAGDQPPRASPTTTRRTGCWPPCSAICRCSTCSGAPLVRPRSTCCCFAVAGGLRACPGRYGMALTARQPPAPGTPRHVDQAPRSRSATTTGRCRRRQRSSSAGPGPCRAGVSGCAPVRAGCPRKKGYLRDAGKPAVPHRAARRAWCRSASAACSATRANRPAGRGPPRSPNTVTALDEFPPRPPGVPPVTCSRFSVDAEQVPRGLRHVQGILTGQPARVRRGRVRYTANAAGPGPAATR